MAVLIVLRCFCHSFNEQGVEGVVIFHAFVRQIFILKACFAHTPPCDHVFYPIEQIFFLMQKILLYAESFRCNVCVMQYYREVLFVHESK